MVFLWTKSTNFPNIFIFLDISILSILFIHLFRVCYTVTSLIYSVFFFQLYQISLAILNARMSLKSFRIWSAPVVLPVAKLILSKFSLIVPLVCTGFSVSKVFCYNLYWTFICYRATHRPSIFSYCKHRHWPSIFLVIWNLVCHIS